MRIVNQKERNKNKMMEGKKTHILLFALFFGAFCFGSGVFFGQYLLTEKGFVYEEGAAEKEMLPESSAESSGRMNLNTAEEENLRQVKGIGSVTAKKIVTSREEEGLFEDAHDLVTRGIMGEVKYREVEPFLTAE